VLEETFREAIFIPNGTHAVAQPLLTAAELRDEQTRSITAENPDGAPGAGGQASSNLGEGRKGRPCITIDAGKTVTIADIDGPGKIRHIWITVPDATDGGNHVLRDLVLRAYWDGENDPSIEVPLGDFFCNGHATRCNINSEPVVVAPDGGFNCYLPMPFEEARITIESQHPAEITSFFYQIDFAEGVDIHNDGRLHAHWRRSNPTTKGNDHVILDGVQGRGHYIGTYLAWTALSDGWWGEGEVKFYLDGDGEYPTICGTGTEDYVGGAWCFKPNDEPETYSTPYLGYPLHDSGTEGAGHPPRHGLYRWHTPDPIRFEEEIRATIQTIGLGRTGYRERSDDVSSVAYWYQEEPHNPFSKLPSALERRPR
jgi:hypothetical protein